jgi:hypothetical protein
MVGAWVAIAVMEAVITHEIAFETLIVCHMVLTCHPCVAEHFHCLFVVGIPARLAGLIGANVKFPRRALKNPSFRYPAEKNVVVVLPIAVSVVGCWKIGVNKLVSGASVIFAEVEEVGRSGSTFEKELRSGVEIPCLSEVVRSYDPTAYIVAG